MVACRILVVGPESSTVYLIRQVVIRITRVARERLIRLTTHGLIVFPLDLLVPALVLILIVVGEVLVLVSTHLSSFSSSEEFVEHNAELHLFLQEVNDIELSVDSAHATVSELFSSFVLVARSTLTPREP